MINFVSDEENTSLGFFEKVKSLTKMIENNLFLRFFIEI